MLIWGFHKMDGPPLLDFPHVCAEFVLAVQVTYTSALAMEDQVISHPSSRVVVETSRHLCFIVGSMFIDGRLDCYSSFAKIRDKKMTWKYVTLVPSCH